MYTDKETEMLTDALDMAIASNKRMQTAKPRFHVMFATILADLTALKLKVSQNSNTVAKK